MEYNLSDILLKPGEPLVTALSRLHHWRNAYMGWGSIPCSRERHLFPGRGTGFPCAPSIVRSNPVTVGDVTGKDDGALRFSKDEARRMYADKTVSCIGMCQSPMLMIEEGMKVLEKGQVLQVTADRPDLVESVRSWATENGHNIEEELVASGVTTFIMRKGTAPAAKTT